MAIADLPKLDIRGGVCECGHSHQWHNRGEPGPTWDCTGPCLVGLCACKNYAYSGSAVGHLLHDDQFPGGESLFGPES